MTATLALAGRLRALDDTGLREVLCRRTLPKTHLDDFFDLAEALLDRRSIQAALATLDRHALAALATPAGPATPEARHLLLADENGVPYEEVGEVLDSWPASGLPDAAALAGPAPAPAGRSAPRCDDALASECAFRSVTAVTELLAELGREPGHELQKGGLALPDRRRLAAAASLALDEVDAIVSLARRAGLIVRRGDLWLPSDAAHDWTLRATPERWGALAGAWDADVPAGIRRTILARSDQSWGEELRAAIAWQYPAGGDALAEQVEVLQRDAAALGVTAAGVASSAGMALLTGEGVDRAAETIAAGFPHEVDQVYLQPDLTLISPGTLVPAVDARLRTMAEVETRAQASTYRVTAASVNRAIAGGESGASILAFLDSVSLTGVPQPVEYLVSETAARFGLLRVAPAAEPPARSVIRSTNAALLAGVEVDQSLTSLRLRRLDDHTLMSNQERDVVFWALSDARYPVAAEDQAGTVVRLRRHSVPDEAAVEETDAIGDLIARLRENQAEDPKGAWLARQLELAVRSRVPISVTVELPGGDLAEYQLEPTGIGGGRLRGRDRRSDTERTLPLSRIRRAEPTGE